MSEVRQVFADACRSMINAVLDDNDEAANEASSCEQVNLEDLPDDNLASWYRQTEATLDAVKDTAALLRDRDEPRLDNLPGDAQEYMMQWAEDAYTAAVRPSSEPRTKSPGEIRPHCNH